MKAIETRYLGPTDRRGSRIVATAEGGHRVVIGYDYSQGADGNHMRAAKALCAKLNWDTPLLGGHTQRGMVWVFRSALSPRIARRVRVSS